MTKGIDTKGLLDALNRRAGGGEKEKVTSDLTETQQADELLAHVTAFNAPETFKISDFVRYRPERRNLIKNAERLHIVIGKIDPPERIEISEDTRGDPYTYRVYDTLISLCDPNEKGAVLTFACDARDLEHFPNGDRLKGQGTA